jgi:hypothetical protein
MGIQLWRSEAGKESWLVVNSREKGKRGERAFAKLCREYGYKDVRRGQQYSGVEGEDVINLPGIHAEVKNVQRLNVREAVEQAKRDAADGKFPIVFHKTNYAGWMTYMPVEVFFELYREWEAGKAIEESKDKP